MDFQRVIQRYYPQAGVGLAGLTAGPKPEKRKAENLLSGFQTSLWANYFAGVNMTLAPVE